MAFNWQITVATPVLTSGMGFVVRYKKNLGNWVNFLPNPTTNTFTIPNLQEGEYTAEIRLLCLDQSISAPKYITNNCGDAGVAPTVSIFWYDLNNTIVRNCELENTYPIGFLAQDIDNDIVLIELQSSTNGTLWTTIAIVPQINDFYNIDSGTSVNTQYRFRVTDSQNNVSVSNSLQVACNIINPTQSLSINSSMPNLGSGTLDFINGEPNETISLRFTVTADVDFSAISFASPVAVSVIDVLHQTRIGSILLNSLGSASSTYTFLPTTTNSSCLVEIIGRSSSNPIPTSFSTNISN